MNKDSDTHPSTHAHTDTHTHTHTLANKITKRDSYIRWGDGGRGGGGEGGSEREGEGERKWGGGGRVGPAFNTVLFVSTHWTKHVPNNSLVPLTLRNEAGEITART